MWLPVVEVSTVGVRKVRAREYFPNTKHEGANPSNRESLL